MRYRTGNGNCNGSKPEELRAYIEEVAGISVYKEEGKRQNQGLKELKKI